MPAISLADAPLVLVSGANGYVAMHVVEALLVRGYRVRGVVRAESKAAHIRETFARFASRLEVVFVADIAASGAFRDALVGVDAIAHMAAYVGFSVDDPQDLIVPAVKGTIGIMKSALDEGTTVKRIVYVSSTSTVAEPGNPPKVYTEENWNDVAVKVTEAKGREAPGMFKYSASKVLAERAAWSLYEESKAASGWDLVSLCPSFVYGPFLHEHTGDSSKLTASLDIWYKNVIDCTLDDEALVAGGTGWVDVRDVALSVVLALETPSAGGERIIVCGGDYVWQDMLDVANELPSPYAGKLKIGKPGAGLSRPGAVPLNRYDTAKAKRVLNQGLGAAHPWRSMKECVGDMLIQFGQRGWGL